MQRDRAVHDLRVLYLDRFELPLSFENRLNCKICGSSLRLIKKRKNTFLSVVSCSCQKKKGNKAYMNSVFGVGTKLSEKYWMEYCLKAYKKGPLKDKLIARYGKREGRKRYASFLKKCNVSLKGFIDRYGQDEGLRKYDDFKRSSLNNKEAMVKRHGEKEGAIRYNLMVEKMRKRSKFTLAYWIDFFEGDYELACNTYKMEQARGLPYFIRKYGEEEGEKRYQKLCEVRKSQNSVQYRVNKYGEIDGKKKWEKECRLKGVKQKLDYYIEKYGKKEGEKRYQEFCRSKLCTLSSFENKFGKERGREKYIDYRKAFLKGRSLRIRKSKFQNEFVEEVLRYGRFSNNALLFGDSELLIFDHGTGAGFFYDLCSPKTKKIVEIHGDYWHANPQIYNSDYYHPVKKIKASQIWAADKIKEILAEKNGYDVLVVWEKDIRFNRYPEIKKCIKFLKS